MRISAPACETANPCAAWPRGPLQSKTRAYLNVVAGEAGQRRRWKSDEKCTDSRIRVGQRDRRALQLVVFGPGARELAAVDRELHEGREARATSGSSGREWEGCGDFARRCAAGHPRRAEERAGRQERLPRGEVWEVRAELHGAEGYRCGQG